MTVRTRFAPSPTGKTHIGGVRTALFNWLFAKHHGGQFILRIDDTDQGRHVESAISPILTGLEWLGITWDEGPKVNGPHTPYFQSSRQLLYQDWAERLLSTGAVYKDYSTAEEREADRKAAESTKRPYRFREKTYNVFRMEEFHKQKTPYCLRFRVPLDKTIIVHDKIRGEVVCNTNNLSDFVIMRADNSPLYSFATTVDDALMSISHVIRSEEHLSNTFPQILLYEAMGFSPPIFAHIPYVAAPNSKKKMSNRDGGAGLEEYIGDYLPEAMMNYLARLGWSMDDRTEMFTRDELIKNFSLERVVKAPASHDINKLHWFQSEWMKTQKTSEKFVEVAKVLFDHKLINPRTDLLPYRLPSDEDVTKIYAVIDALGDRLKKFSDIITYGGFFFMPLSSDMRAVEKRLFVPNAKKVILELNEKFKAMTEWNVTALEKVVHDYGTEKVFTMGLIVNALRVAVTGVSVGPGLFDTLVIFGQEETISRIEETNKMCSVFEFYNRVY